MVVFVSFLYFINNLRKLQEVCAQFPVAHYFIKKIEMGNCLTKSKEEELTEQNEQTKQRAELIDAVDYSRQEPQKYLRISFY